MPTNGNEEKVSERLGRVDTDSVHIRLKEDSVKCTACNKCFPANETAIREHFGPSHPGLPEPCVYCEGKRFAYIMYQVDANGDKVVPREEIYHSCRVHGKITAQASESAPKIFLS